MTLRRTPCIVHNSTFFVNQYSSLVRRPRFGMPIYTENEQAGGQENDQKA